MKLNALRWTAAAALAFAAESAFAQVPPGQPAPGAPGATPADRPPGESPQPPQDDFNKIQQAVTPYKAKPMGTRVKFNLQDADLAELVNHISGMTGKRFIYGPKVRQIKATVVSPEPVTLAEAYEAFLSILEANGMTVLPHGQFLKIVDTAGASTQSTPIYSRGAPVPDTDRYITRLYRLKNTSADEVAALLAKFKSKDGDISTYPPGQLLIVTDTGAQVQRMIRIVEELDVGGAGSKMWIEPVHNGSAQDMAQRINELFDLGKGGEGAGVGGLTKVVPDEQTNSLVVVGTEDSYLKLLELMKKLDEQPQQEGKVHVLPLQHSVADELANTLNQMLQTAAKEGKLGGIFEGDVRVTADKATNSLVITSSGRDYASLRLVVDDLDMPRRQVFIEAVIMSLGVENSDSLGLKYHGGAMERILGDRDSLIFGGLAPMGSLMPPNPADPSLLQGFALGVRGPELDGASELLGIGVSVPAFGVMLNALAKSGNTNVLATPHILATDNTPAEINVGENIPLQENIGGLPNLGGLAGGQAGGAQQLAGLGGLLGGGFGFNTPRQDVGTKIKVTPHVNKSNQVRLEIEQEISERGATSGTLGAVSIVKRNVSTTLVVDDQQTVVIGGLMRDETVKNRDKIPVLGDLPVLGFLFRSSTKSTRKTNLLLVLTPYVIHDQADLRRIFERKMQERQEFLDRYFVFSGEDWKPPQDYSRTNGLVEDIRQAYFEIEERQRLEDESVPKTKRLHEPSEAIELPMDVKPGAAPGRAPAQTAPQPGQPAQPTPAAPTRRRRRTPPAATPPATPTPPAARPQGLLNTPLHDSPMARNVGVERTE